MQNSQLRALYQDTLEKITKNPKQLQAFLTQNSYLHQLPFEEIVQIHGQNKNATLLKTWEDWKIVGSAPLKGQTALQSLKEFNNRYSKRNNYFDVAQLAHKNIDIEETILTTEHVKAYLSLNKWNFDSQEDTLTNYLNFLKKVSVQALNNFEFLTPDEKQIVPLVAQYNLVRTYNLALDDDLSLINNEVFKALNQENIRFDRVIKIGNNLSTKQVELISEQKDLIGLTAQSLIEENFKKELEAFESSVSTNLKETNEVSPTQKVTLSTEQQNLVSAVLDDGLTGTGILAGNPEYQVFHFDFELPADEKVFSNDEYDKFPLYAYEKGQPLSVLKNRSISNTSGVLVGSLEFSKKQAKNIGWSDLNARNHISSDRLAALIEMTFSNTWGELLETSENVPVPHEIITNIEEYKEMIERGYSQLYDSYMHYQDLKLNGQNVSGAYDTFDFQTNTEKVQLGFNYIGREQGTDDDSKVVFWASTDTEAYSTDPMSTPIRSRIMPTFEEALQTLNFEIGEQPHAADEKINKDVESTSEIETNTSISQFDEKALLEKIKNDFNLDDEFVISENNGEIALQKVSFGGVLTEFVVKLDSGDIEISDVADSITNIKNFTTEIEKIIDDFRNEPTEPKIPNNDEVVAEDNSNDVKLLSDEALEEQIIENYGRMVGAEGSGYSPKSFSRWAELREEENRRRAQNETKEISLFDEVETDSKAPTDEQLYRADEILSEMIEDVEQRQPQIMSEWSGGLQHLKLSQMVGQKREVLVTLDLQSGQLIPDETFLDKWTIEQKEMLRQRLSEVMDIPYEAKTQLELEAPLNNEPLVDFEFPEDLSEFYPKTPTEKVNANLQAIQLVKQIDVENRGATPAEQDILAKYVGWGGLANEFFDENRLKFASQRQELKTIVSDKEYQAMRESSLTAYYTDPMIIRNMYKELEENGFKGGRILDPAMGTGNFFSAMPKHLRENSELYGVELDTITGSIAKLLHPQANIKIQGFETVDFNPDSFDVVVGNVPFANFTINDARLKKPYLIHDYFFKKSLNLVRTGGLVSFITSTGTMDKRNSSFRKELHQEAGLIGAIRLPNTAFKAIAGTDVATDILTLQKGQTRSIGYWEESSEVQDSSGEIIEGVQANQFFSKESSLAVLGTFEVKNFNGKTLSVRSTPDMDIISEIDKARAFHHQLIPGISSYYSGTELEALPPAENSKNNLSQFISLPEEVQNLAPQTHLIFDDKIYFHDPNDGIIEKNEAWYKAGYKQLYDEFDNPKFDKLGRPKMGNTRGTFDGKTLARLKGMTQISKKVEAIVNYQIENPITEAEDVQFEYLLKELNRVYDDFINDKNLYLKSGNALNNPKNTKIFEDDINFYRMLSIENEVKDEDGSVKYVKGDFFFKKTISPAT